MLLANKLFTSVLLPMPKGMFQTRDGFDTLKRLSFIIYNSPKPQCIHIFVSGGIEEHEQPEKSAKVFWFPTY